MTVAYPQVWKQGGINKMIIVDIRQSDMLHAGKGFAAQINACGILATDHTDRHGFNSR